MISFFSFTIDIYVVLYLLIALKNIVKQDEKIPTHFKCVDEYLGLYSQFILAEIRSNLKVSLQNLILSPYYNVKEMLRCESSEVFFVDINLTDIQLKSDHSYRVAQDGDLFLFSSHPPHCRDFDSSLDFLGIVFNTSQCASFHRGFKVLVSDQNCTRCYEENSKFGIFLINIMDAMKAWSVFNFDKTEDNCSGIKSILNISDMVRENNKKQLFYLLMFSVSLYLIMFYVIY